MKTMPHKAPPAPYSPPAQRRPAHAARTSLRYWVCLGVLVSAALGVHGVARVFGIVTRKAPVPLKLPLARFDATRLGGGYEYNAALTERIPPMSEDMIASLGTTEYMQLYVDDTAKPATDPTRTAMVFVTYYTGKPDLVPHVPDECYLAGGYDKISEATVRVPVPGVGVPGDEIAVRVLEFRARTAGFSAGPPETATVMYFFHANGDCVTTRNEVRLSMANPFERSAYYAKIEVTFNNGAARAGKAASVAALGPLLARLMPQLLADHFDLREFTSTGAALPG
jgi:hypothetical protein